MFDPHERYRSVTHLDVVRVNRTIVPNNHFVKRYYKIKPAWRVDIIVSMILLPGYMTWSVEPAYIRRGG